MTLSLMVTPLKAANHSAHVMVTALMTTVAKPPSAYVCANPVHAASMPIVMLASTVLSADVPKDTKDNPRAVAQRPLHQSVTLPHVYPLMFADLTHVVQMPSAVTVVSAQSAPAPSDMKEIR